MYKSDYYMIRRLAKLYRSQYPEKTIRSAVFKAFEAFDFFRDAEIEVQDWYYNKKKG